MPVATVNGIELYYEQHGAGPPLLNIGGSSGDLRRTFPASSPLNRHFSVLSYDQRGLGRSAKPEHDYTMDDYADDAAALVEHVFGEPCRVLGTSFGGMVAQVLALRHPRLVERMAVLCSSPGGDHHSFPLHAIAGMSPEEAMPIQMRLLDRRWDPDATEPIPGLGPIYDLIVDQYAAEPDPATMAGLVRQLAARAGHDVVDRLSSITCPTLVCAGRYDDQAPMENSELMAEKIPGAELAVFEGGHLFVHQDPAAFPAIIEFLLRDDGDPRG